MQHLCFRHSVLQFIFQFLLLRKSLFTGEGGYVILLSRSQLLICLVVEISSVHKQQFSIIHVERCDEMINPCDASWLSSPVYSSLLMLMVSLGYSVWGFIHREPFSLCSSCLYFWSLIFLKMKCYILIWEVHTVTLTKKLWLYLENLTYIYNFNVNVLLT